MSSRYCAILTFPLELVKIVKHGRGKYEIYK